jgi:hypothetical protein
LQEWIRYLLIARMLRLLRLLTYIDRYRAVVNTFLKLIPAMGPLFGVLFGFLSLFTRWGVVFRLPPLSIIIQQLHVSSPGFCVHFPVRCKLLAVIRWWVLLSFRRADILSLASSRLLRAAFIVLVCVVLSSVRVAPLL